LQFRELSSSERVEAFALLTTLRPDLTTERFDGFIAAHYPQEYRLIGAFERGELEIYAGVSIRENFELGRHLIIDDFAVYEGCEDKSGEMIDYLCDYAKIYKCESIILYGKQRGLSIDDLSGFRPKRDGFIKKI
jgi:hypothetical protein